MHCLLSVLAALPEPGRACTLRLPLSLSHRFFCFRLTQAQPGRLGREQLSGLRLGSKHRQAMEEPEIGREGVRKEENNGIYLVIENSHKQPKDNYRVPVIR